MKKILCLLLIACLLIPSLIACSNQEEDDAYIDAKTAMDAVTGHYSILFAKDYKGSEQAASNLVKALKEFADVEEAKLDTEVKETRRELLIGVTSRQESKDAASDVSYYDYKIAVKNKKILILAGSETAYGWALDRFTTLLKEDQLDFSVDSEILEKLPIDPNSIAFNFNRFTPNWLAGSNTPAPWLTNKDGNNLMEKAYALTRPQNSDHRITSQTHRGDVVNYSEGSLESVASCIWAGIDVMEFDIRFTKDGVAILHHDDTLSRMTNVSEFVGKEGYPATEIIADWTYAQITSLNLKQGIGGKDAQVTTYKVPTLYEALLVSANRIFIQIDDKNSIMSSANLGFYPIAEATGSKISFMTQFDTDRAHSNKGNGNNTKVLNIMQKWLSYDTSDASFSTFVGKLEGWLKKDGVMRGEPYWPNPNSEFQSWQTHANLVELDDTWDDMLDKDYYHIWTENPVALITYIKTNCRAEIVP